MDYDELVAKVIELLQRDKRVPYRVLKRRFDLDDDYIEDLKIDLIEAKQLTVDENDRILVWISEAATTPNPAPTQPSQPNIPQETQPAQVESPSVKSRTQEAERRQLTVMFCDLVGSTSLSGQLDPEDYREVVRAYQTACAEVTERLECHIAQTLGDGLLIYSGYPVAHENDAERAVRVGLGILDAMKALNERLEQGKGIQIAVRIGIHTGTVVVGDVGAGTRQEQLALGEVPNLAARLQGLADPDTVVISAATYRLIEGYFECEGLGEQDLRGVSQPVVVYRVWHESGIQNRLDIASRQGLTPLVGREQEVGLLLDRWEQAKNGQGQVILLSGEAGIGKSRLVQVLKDHVADASHTRLECRSSPYFTNSALYPIIEMVQRALHFQTDDTPEQKLEKLKENLSQYHQPLGETVPLFGALLSVPIPEDCYPPLHLTPQRQRQKTLEAILAIILELAERQPVLFILEDLHWTDPTTLEFIELLIDQIPTASIDTLLTCRPEFQPFWSHRSYLTEMSINRLSRDQIERMAKQVVGEKHLPDELVQQLVDKTDGVPLYVEEMIKVVLESGVLKESDSQYELAGSMTSLSIPATLQDSLMARLDRLVTAKAVAQYAAVIGREFSYVLLQAVSELDGATLQRELGRLVEAELVYQRGLPPAATYIFKHALIQDTAYQSLLRSTRQQYHQQIATVLESQFADIGQTSPELLAHHYAEAGFNEQAIDYWQRAGERAIEHSAYVEAIGHLTRGIALLSTFPDTLERTKRELALQNMLGQAVIATKGYGADEVARIYMRARELSQQVDETTHVFPVMYGIWVFHYIRAEFRTAHELGLDILRLAQRQDEEVPLLVAHRLVGTTLVFLGQFSEAEAHLEQALSLYDRQRHRVLARQYSQDIGVAGLSFLSWTRWMVGYPDQALARAHEALALARNIAHPFSLAFALNLVARVYCFRRETNAAHEIAKAAVTLCQEQGLGAWLGSSIRYLTLTARQPDEEAIFQVYQGRLELVDNARAYWLAMLAQAYEKREQAEVGLDLLSEALADVSETDAHFLEAELYRLKGELLLSWSSDNATESGTCFQQAIAIAQNQSAKSWELRAATSPARLWQQQGKRQKAYDLLAPVYGWFTEGFDTADLQDAKALLDDLERSQ